MQAMIQDEAKELIFDSGLVLASKNRYKIQELHHLLKSFKIQIRGIEEIDSNFFVEEIESTFEGNSSLKARACWNQTGIPSLADDSGLEIDFLNGRPGIYSARYGGEGLTDEDRCSLLLDEMKDVSQRERTARFVCVLALCVGGEERMVFFFRGEAEGMILDRMSGKKGFGYDPIFYDPFLKLSFAELSKEQKNLQSHRGKALRKFQEALLH